MSPRWQKMAAAAALALLALPAHPAAGEGKSAAETDGKVAAPNLAGVKQVMKDAVKDALPGAIKGGAPPAPAAAPAAPADPAAAMAGRLALLRRKTLRDDDFLDNDERNRDPFRSYLRLFTSKEGPKASRVPAILDKFALEELTLIGIVSGDATPRAMFRDPAGVGQTIKRGDYVSKVAARVTKILSDRVILELNEVTGTGETRAVEKPVLVNPEGAQK
jgi:type IV pilus assembly PilP-like protein